MAFVKDYSMVFSMVMMVALFGVCFGGTEYKVGDSNGWTANGVNYKDWAASKTFYVGDAIVFEYNAKEHNVVRVTHKNFQACNSTGAISITASGKERVELKKPDHLFFICGVPGHCQAGQKVDIRVLASSSSQGPNPSQSPESSPSHTPAPSSSNPNASVSPANAPVSPKKSSAPSAQSSKWLLMLVMAMGVLAFIV